MHLHVHYVCQMPSNYNIVTYWHAGDEVWQPATISQYRHGFAHDIAIQKNPTIQALHWTSMDWR